MPTRVPWKAVAAGGVALGAIGAAVLLGRSRTPSVPQRVGLIGDSYAVGLGPELAKLIATFKFEGHVGISTLGWNTCGGCGSWIPAFAPTLMLVSLGVNDGLSPNPANYQAIVQKLHGLGARVVWIEPPAAVSTSNTNVPAVRDIIESLGVQVVAPTQTPLSADNLHPRNYAQWAGEIAQAIGAV